MYYVSSHSRHVWNNHSFSIRASLQTLTHPRHVMDNLSFSIRVSLQTLTFLCIPSHRLKHNKHYVSCQARHVLNNLSASHRALHNLLFPSITSHKLKHDFISLLGLIQGMFLKTFQIVLECPQSMCRAFRMVAYTYPLLVLEHPYIPLVYVKRFQYKCPIIGDCYTLTLPRRLPCVHALLST